MSDSIKIHQAYSVSKAGVTIWQYAAFNIGKDNPAISHFAPINGDKEQLPQLLANALANAIAQWLKDCPNDNAANFELIAKGRVSHLIASNYKF